MAKEQQVTCRYCKKKIDKSTAYSVTKGSYYCDEECYEISESKNKAKFKSSDGSSRLKYTDYIQSIYVDKYGYDKSQLGSSFWAMISKQTNSLMQEYGVKYSGIEYTLWYMIEVKEMQLLGEEYDGTVLNLVGYYIDEAKQYWKKCDNIKQLVKDFDFDDNIIVVKKGNIDRGKRWKEIRLDEL